MLDKKEKILKEADYILAYDVTIRELGEVFHRSKSAVHKDLTVMLKKINEEKYQAVEKLLENHLNTRHIKGGESTRKKYQNLK